MPTRRSFLTTSAAAGMLAAASVHTGQATESTSRTMAGYRIPRTDLTVSRIAYGCATLVKFDRTPLGAEALATAERAIHAAYDNGITFFDLADHYGLFKSEVAFGQVLKRSPALRDKITIQSKCGVHFRDGRPSDPVSHFFDCSYHNIINSVEGSLRRLDIERMDILLLHYPDALTVPEEVARAFDELRASGKVRHFGVSNHTASQIELLRKYVRQPLVANQIQLGLSQPSAIADGLNGHSADSGRVTGVIDYCRLHEMSMQAYSPLRGELLSPQENAAPEIRRAAQVLGQIADQRNTTPWVIALSWLLRHPANIIPIIGSTNPKHIADNCKAASIGLDRDEWYRLFVAAANALPA